MDNDNSNSTSGNSVADAFKAVMSARTNSDGTVNINMPKNTQGGFVSITEGAGLRKVIASKKK